MSPGRFPIHVLKTATPAPTTDEWTSLVFDREGSRPESLETIPSPTSMPVSGSLENLGDAEAEYRLLGVPFDDAGDDLCKVLEQYEVMPGDAITLELPLSTWPAIRVQVKSVIPGTPTTISCLVNVRSL